MQQAMPRLCLAALLSVASTWSAPASAENRKVKIINETSYTVVRFYGSNAGAESWQEDVLGDDVIKPGGSVTVNFDDGSGYCKFDFKAVFSDGDVVEKRGIDVCEVAVYRITE
jgi:hypothetical protein